MPMRPFEPNAITHIVCDFSDVLVKGLEGSEKLLAAHLGISEADAHTLLFEEDYTPLWLGKISESEFMARIAAKDQRLAVDDLQRIVRANFKRIDETWEIFRTLAKSRTLIMLSVNCREWVEYLDMRDELEIVFGPRIHYSYELGATKRTTHAFEHILKTYNLTLRQLLFIDDSRKNVAVAEAMGIASICFETPEQLFTDLRKTRILKA
jgi:FMN phosphatase YigB (HAD superfamily)